MMAIRYAWLQDLSGGHHGFCGRQICLTTSTPHIRGVVDTTCEGQPLVGPKLFLAFFFFFTWYFLKTFLNFLLFSLSNQMNFLVYPTYNKLSNVALTENNFHFSLFQKLFKTRNPKHFSITLSVS
jgi:hypothetical protein